MSLHLSNGAIQSHFLGKHGRKISPNEIVGWTKIRACEGDTNRLEIWESLIILQEDPMLNRQDTGKKRILNVYGKSNRNK